MDVQHLKPVHRTISTGDLFSSRTFRVLFAASMVLAVVVARITYWACSLLLGS